MCIRDRRNRAKVELVSNILGHSSVGITMDVYRTVTQGEIKAEDARYGPSCEEKLCVTLSEESRKPLSLRMDKVQFTD